MADANYTARSEHLNTLGNIITTRKNSTFSAAHSPSKGFKTLIICLTDQLEGVL